MAPIDRMASHTDLNAIALVVGNARVGGAYQRCKQVSARVQNFLLARRSIPRSMPMAPS